MPSDSDETSLRSPLRKNPLPADCDSTPTIISTSAASMHLGKRGRPNATVKAEHAASKRQKVLGTFDAKPARQLPTGDQEPKTTRKHAGAADREAGLPGGPRVTSAVQPPPNGTITTTQTLTNGEAQPLIQVTATSAHTNGPQESDKRTLRSHDGGSRSKSELAQYFPNFDEIVSNERKEAGTWRPSSKGLWEPLLTMA